MNPYDSRVLDAADAWQAARDLYLSDGTEDRQRALWHAEAELAVAVRVRSAVAAAGVGGAR